ncbi:MoaD/ThiS family protein [bacterium]|nr:MoaD/ThiS family protein [bacterium]
MNTITFNAFSFLQPKLRSKNINYSNAKMELPEGITLKELVIKLGLKPEDVEAAFVNNKVVSMDSILHNNDRVTFIPPGTPGPYRVLLGMVKQK